MGNGIHKVWQWVMVCIHVVCTYVPNLNHIDCINVTQGSKTRRLSFLAFILHCILHSMCFRILFTESKYLVSNWSYTRLIRRIKKVKKSIKRFMIFRVFIILWNHCFIILKLFWTIKLFILNQIKQTTLKSGYNFTTSWQIHGHQLNLRIANSKTPLSYLGL